MHRKMTTYSSDGASRYYTLRCNITLQCINLTILRVSKIAYLYQRWDQ